MVFFFDNNIVKLECNNDMVIYYSSYVHNTIRVDKTTAEVIECLLENGSGIPIDMKKIMINCNLTLDVAEEILSSLIDTDLFYENGMDLRINEFASVRERFKKFKIETAYLHLSYKCNLNCEYCYNKEKINTCSEISIEQWKNVLNVLKNTGTHKIMLTGGEPTLYPYFNDVVKYAVEQGLTIQVLTNGTTLGELDKQVIEMVSLFIVSLDSLDVGVNHRKNIERYSVLDNIMNLYRNGGSVNVRSVVTSKNSIEVKKLGGFLKAHEIEHIQTVFIPNSKEEKDLVPDLNDVNYSEQEYELCDIKECGAAYSIIAISPEGIVYPCQTLMFDEFAITDIFKENWYKELGESLITQYFLHRRVANIEGCNTCGYRTLCSGGCRSIAYNVYGDIEHKLDYFCELYKRESVNDLAHIKFG